MVSFEPRNQERERKRGKVKLFYVGLDYHNAHKGNPPPVYVKTTALEMPELGEHFIIDEVMAHDLMQRTRFHGKPIFMLEGEGGGDIANMLQAGNYDPDEDFEKVRARHIALQHLSKEDLELLLEEKGGKKATPPTTKRVPKKAKEDNN